MQEEKNFTFTHTHTSHMTCIHLYTHPALSLLTKGDGEEAGGGQREVGYSSVLFATATLDKEGMSAGAPLLASCLHIWRRCGKGMRLPYATLAKGRTLHHFDSCLGKAAQELAAKLGSRGQWSCHKPQHACHNT